MARHFPEAIAKLKSRLAGTIFRFPFRSGNGTRIERCAYDLRGLIPSRIRGHQRRTFPRYSLYRAPNIRRSAGSS
jgi:hypothetical protein